ncbi:MAG: ABC transporter ATP-binding protein/permease [Thermoleophilia bacterium]|nr:ABC transporter ATP-binding protein/permease [Thermoleophilia bacterium]
MTGNQAVPETAESTSGERAPLLRLWDYAQPHRPRVIWATVMSALNKVFDVMPELIIGLAVDVVVRGDSSLVSEWFGVEDRWHQLLILGVVNVIVWGGESLTEYLAAVAWRNLAQTLQHEARMDAYTHVQDLELAYFEDRSSGGLLAILNDDVNQLERFLDVGANAIIITIVNVIVVGAIFVTISPVLALFAFAPIPIILLGTLLYQRRLAPRYTAVRARVGDLSGSLSNNLGGIATIKAFTAEKGEVERIGAQSDAYRAANREAIRVSSAFVPLIRMAILAGFTVTLLAGGWAALNGSLRLGLYSVLVFMTQRLLWPLTRLGETFDLYQRAMASTRRILDLLETEPTILPGERTLPRPVMGELNFTDVRFAYPGGAEVIRGLSIDVPAGETHAIVGLTGSGKSTLVKLLLRFYEHQSGEIRLDGVPVGELQFEELRGATGLVAQDSFLFDGTVRENIAYGRPDAPLEDVERAAELAEAREFITGLPRGYDTVVGERGQKLSGGQRQRLALARAILSDPAVLILDEATSSVDNETEMAIQRSLQTISKGRTTLVIAHRLSTVRGTHRIHVIESGIVSESGTHDELISAGGLYAALWRVQTGADLARSA